MKKVLFITLFTSLLVSFDNPHAAKFKLSFSTYNQAEGFNTMIYHYSLEGNELTMHMAYMHADSRTEDQYTITLKQQDIARLQAIKLDGLKTEYFNHCVLATSGSEYSVSAGFGNDIKEIHLHHYYKEEIAQLTAELNKSLPEKYQINYVDKDTKQDCN